MLQQCQVAELDQCTEETAAAEEQRGSFASGVVHGEEGEAMAVSGLSSLLAEKTVLQITCKAVPSTSLQMTSPV